MFQSDLWQSWSRRQPLGCHFGSCRSADSSRPAACCPHRRAKSRHLSRLPYQPPLAVRVAAPASTDRQVSLAGRKRGLIAASDAREGRTTASASCGKCTIASGRAASLSAATLSAIISTVCASSVRRRPAPHGTSHCSAFSTVVVPHERQANGGERGGGEGGGGLGLQRAATLAPWQDESSNCRPRRTDCCRRDVATADPQRPQSASRCEFSSTLRDLAR